MKYTITDKDGNIVEEGTYFYQNKAESLLDQEYYATSIPYSGPEDGMIYTNFTGTGKNDNKQYDILYLQSGGETHHKKRKSAKSKSKQGGDTHRKKRDCC